ncbi:hypothetical protein ISG29_15470 [Nocardioides sp. CBS4Y-1]|uniref:Magnesium transporter n=1 Tax=Nocardioides acrostichi TaxID=2784339 RepID=A0A930V330_9ACTN|nr:hypothetical protein [Nocardioides acrostichi]
MFVRRHLSMVTHDGLEVFAFPVVTARVHQRKNFTHMPELDWTFGYAYALTLMAATAGLLWWFFKRSGWL